MKWTLEDFIDLKRAEGYSEESLDRVREFHSDFDSARISKIWAEIFYPTRDHFGDFDEE